MIGRLFLIVVAGGALGLAVAAFVPHGDFMRAPAPADARDPVVPADGDAVAAPPADDGARYGSGYDGADAPRTPVQDDTFGYAPPDPGLARPDDDGVGVAVEDDGGDVPADAAPSKPAPTRQDDRDGAAAADAARAAQDVRAAEAARTP